MLKIHSPILPKNIIRNYTKYQKKRFFSKLDYRHVFKGKSIKSVISRKEIQTIVRKQFSQDIVKIKTMTRSTLHQINKITTRNREYIIRIYNLKDTPALHFYIERWIVNILKEKKLPFIKINKIDISRRIVPYDYQIEEVARGSTLHDFLAGGKIPLKLIKKMGKIIAKFHQIKTFSYGPVKIDSLNGKASGIYESWDEFFLCNLGYHLKLCIKYNILSQKEAAQIKDILLDIKNQKNPKSVLLHGDIAHHNIFTDGKEITAIIDWEDSLCGDPLFDIAYYATGCFGKDAWFSSFIAGYESVSKTRVSLNKIFWLYYLRIAFVKALTRVYDNTLYSDSLPKIHKRITYGLFRVLESKN